MGDTDKLRPEVKEIPDEILDRAEAVYDEAIDELDGFSTCSRFALGEAIALALSEVNRPAGEPGVAIEWLRRFVVCNPVSSIETWREYSKLAAGFVETVSAELLRLADENKRMRGIIETLDIEGHRRAERAEAELAALKARTRWQPIETAPKNGQTILAHKPSGLAFAARQDVVPVHWTGWGGGAWENSTSGHKVFDDLTHWMPLHEPPAEQGEE